MSKKALLIAEEEESVLHSLAKSFEDKFYVYKAKNGREAWETMQRCNIYCLITDIEMPEMDGLELLENMRKAGYHSKVIVSTKRNCFDTRLRCGELGIEGYLLKPYDTFQLIELVREMNDP